MGPRPEVEIALDALRRAAEHGLEPRDYDSSGLREQLDSARRQPHSADDVAAADIALSVAVVRFASDLRYGRVTPSAVAPHFHSVRKREAFVAGLRSAVAGSRLNDALAAAEPRFPLYARLERLLARYRVFAQQPSPRLPALPPSRKVQAGDRYDGVDEVYERLRRWGDLASDLPAPSDNRYSPALASGISRFQLRHGLQPDGVIGKDTLATLDVAPAHRVTQIILALERLRWLPDFDDERVIGINIPSFKLWTFTNASQGEAVSSMSVIVGKAMHHQTPLFVGEMRSVEFNPYWNVPRNSLRDELLPQLARDRSLLQRQDMELVGSTGKAQAGNGVDDATIAALADGSLRVRQRPGPKNALGRIKFVLPNTMDIYLHDTPATQLFENSRRDFSHGCIRVADPLALADFVLRDNAGWSRPSIEAAMTGGAHRVVSLATPVPVVVFYTTAIADRDGHGVFLPDIYGHDRKLFEALRKASPAFRLDPAD